MILSDGSGHRVPQEPSDRDAQARAPARPDDITGGATVTVATDRTYECLGCGALFGAFRRACPNCNARSFETEPAGEPAGSETPAGELLAACARLTAPYNPYIPR